MQRSSSVWAGRMAAALIRGPALTFDERELSAWLGSTLVRAGPLDSLLQASPAKALAKPADGVGAGAGAGAADGSDSKNSTDDSAAGSSKEAEVDNDNDGEALDEYQSAENNVADGLDLKQIVWGSCLESATEAAADVTERAKTHNASRTGGVPALRGRQLSWRSAAKAVHAQLQGERDAEREAFIDELVSGGHKKGSPMLVLLRAMDSAAMMERSKAKTSFFSVELVAMAALLKHTGLWQEAKSVLEQARGGAKGADIDVSPQLLDAFAMLRAVRDYLTNQRTTFGFTSASPDTEEASGSTDDSNKVCALRQRRSCRVQLARGHPVLTTPLPPVCEHKRQLWTPQAKGASGNLLPRSQAAPDCSRQAPAGTGTLWACSALRRGGRLEPAESKMERPAAAHHPAAPAAPLEEHRGGDAWQLALDWHAVGLATTKLLGTGGRHAARRCISDCIGHGNRGRSFNCSGSNVR